MSVLIIFIQKAIVQGICILYGALGEIMTEKSGNLNLGIPGIMYMGGISGLMGAFFYEKDNPNPNALVGVLISLLCAFTVAALGGLIYSVLTITLRVNQNVTGLALTIFGTGFGNFFGGSISKLAGSVGQISVKVTGSAYTAKIPGLSKIPVLGDLLFSYGFMTYLCIIVAVLLSVFLFKTRYGLNLRAIGENPGTADAAGINVTRYKYLSTCIGAGLAGLGGLYFVMEYSGGTWTDNGFGDRGWLAVALVIFFLHCGNRLMPSGVRFCLEHSTSCIFISRDSKEVCRKYLRLCLMWLRLLFLCLPASVKRRNTSLRQVWDFRTSGKNAKKYCKYIYTAV